MATPSPSQDPTRRPQPGARPAPAAKGPAGKAPAARPAPAGKAPAAARPAPGGKAPAARPAPNARPAPAGKAPAAARPAPQQANGQQAAATKARPAGAAQQEDNEEDYLEPSSGGFMLFLAMPSWLVSMLVHIIILLLLARLTFGPPEEREKQDLVVIPESAVESEEIEEFIEEEFEPVEVEALTQTDLAPSADVEVIATDPVISPVNDLSAAAVQVELNPLGENSAPKNDLLATVGAYAGSGVSGRGAAARAQMVAEAGGSKGSEAAVANALKWLSEHQSYEDGGWNFDHNKKGPCNGRCDHAGSRNDEVGATGMALLPFLGAGMTHKEGKYKENVRAGLAFLIRNMKVQGQMGGFSGVKGGSMYSHGICAIALCESYAMTQDKELLVPAQLSLNYIVYAQDPVGGGWRYGPRQKGDTSVVGWQLMALKSGHMAYLQVPPQVIQGTSRFLDSVEQDSGSQYGYTGPGAGTATTAVGLLCRMYLGWKQDNPALERAIERMDKTGPQLNNLYYSYYATQIMRHNEGETWDRWNARMRDPLVDSQSKEGHSFGSWNMAGGHGGAGGRLYNTAMATMMLEVYYRHMPIYRKQSTEEDFAL